MRLTMILCAGLVLTLGACHRSAAPSAPVADTAGPPKPDVDPYLATTTMLVDHACSNCHAADYARVGPAMTDIAAAFPNASVGDKLRLRISIVQGSTGKWGDAIMPPQKQVKAEEVDQIIDTILATKHKS